MISTRSNHASALALAALLATATPAAAAVPQDLSPPVLRIDGQPIRRDAYTEWLLLHRGELLAPRFADEWALRREADRLGVTIDHERVARELEAELRLRIDGAFDGDRAQWHAELAASGRSEAGRRAERLLELEHGARLAAVASVDRVVPPAAVREEWERVYGPNGRTLDVRLLFRRMTLPARPGETAEERERRQRELRERLLRECNDLRERILAGESFADLARAHSQDASSASSGGLPEGGLHAATWPAPALERIAGLAPGQVSEPIEARGGFWLVELRSLTVTPFEAVEAELRAELLRRGPTPEETDALERRLRLETTLRVLPALFARRAADAPWWTEPVLEIDGTPIPRGELATWLLRLRGEVEARRFLQHHVLDAAAKREGIVIPEEALDARVREDALRTIEHFFDGDRDEWLAQLARSGRDAASHEREARARVRGEMIADELLRGRRVVTDAAVREAWERRYGEDGHLIELRWIRLDMTAPEPVPGQTPEERREALEAVVAATKARIRELRERVENGEDFETLAREHSDDPATRARGGVPEEGYAPRRFPPEAAAHIESLPVGGLSDPLVVASHVFLVEVTAIRDVPLAAVRDELRRELQSRRATPVEVAGLTQDLIEASTLEVLPAMYE